MNGPLRRHGHDLTGHKFVMAPLGLLLSPDEELVRGHTGNSGCAHAKADSGSAPSHFQGLSGDARAIA